MTKLLKLLLICVMLFIFSAPCVTEEPINDEQQGEFSELINQLSSNELKTREESQNKLLAFGEKLITEYQNQKGDRSQSQIKLFAEALSNACRSEDAEIKNRANQIRKYFYFLTYHKIVFSSNRDGKYQIYIMNADGSDTRKLTNDQSHSVTPKCDPNGKKIAFRSSMGNFYIMDIDGKNKEQLAEYKNASIDNFIWSPDGTKFAFTLKQDGVWHLYVMDADGKNKKQLTKHTDKAFIESFSWSPE